MAIDPLADLCEMVADINRAVNDGDLDLNEWETGFIESVGQSLRAGRIPTEKQEAALVKLWEKTNG